VQGPTKAKRVGSQQGLPRLPEMQGQRASTSVWPSVHLRGAGAPKHPLMGTSSRTPDHNTSTSIGSLMTVWLNTGSSATT
jgi:hypothetical protein